MDTFAGQVIFVTGAASGIGRATAEALGRAGAQVVAADIDTAGVEQTVAAIQAAGGRAKAIPLDVVDAARVTNAVEAVVGQYGHLDMAFNIAGIAVVGELRDVTNADWRRLVDTNILGLIHSASAAYQVMRRQGNGQIVNMASLAGLASLPALAAYSATKAAVVSYSELLRAEAAAFGVSVTTLCPGFIESPIYERSAARGLRQERVRELVPFPIMPTDQAVRIILSAVAQRRGLVVFPGHARVLWAAVRLFPGLSSVLHAQSLKQMRSVRSDVAAEGSQG